MAPRTPSSRRDGLTRLGRRVAHAALRRYARAPPRASNWEGADRRVTILLMSAWGMGGTIRAILNLAEQLAARGYQVEVASVQRTRGAPFFGAFPPGVQVTNLDGRTPGASRAKRLIRRLLRGVPGLLMPAVDRAAGKTSLWTDVRLVRLVRRRTGFLIGTRAGFNLMLGDLALPGVIHIGQEHMNLTRKGPRMLEAISAGYPRLDALVTLTGGDAGSYRELLGDRIRVACIPNAVRRLEGASAALDGHTVLAAGRLTRQKGFDLLIPAFGRVHAAHPEWRLRICGHGPQRGALEEQVRAEGLAGVVEIAGPIEDLGSEMAAASLFVLSSRYEGFPLVLIEAMSKGLPVVSTDCPTGPADIVEDRRNGVLVAPGDIDALASGMLALIEDEALRRRCAAAGTTTAQAFSMAGVGEQWDTLLRELWAARRLA
jgi:glycosyltransferase involved in cell wall biosynthesis